MGKRRKNEVQSNAKVPESTLNNQPASVWQMSHAPSIDKGYHWTQHVPIIIFIAIIIMITFMKTYNAPLEGYYWHSDKNTFADFFSYYKSIFIILMGIIAFLMILYRITTQTLIVKRTKLYIFMVIYIISIILSWIFSDYPYYAFHGYIDRFEGSLVLLSYIIMVFYIINTIYTEKNVKWVIYALGITSSLLGIVGLSQFFKYDFFQTDIGKKLITPAYYLENIDKLKFSFTAREIYQTVYNPNYVSFYLTLLIPIFGLLFVSEKNMKRKAFFGGISSLLIFNIIGSKSSGGILGIGVAFLIALIILNKKLLKWWKSIAVIFGAVVLVFALTFNTLMPEITGAIKSAFTPDSAIIQKQKIDYFDTDYNKLIVSCNQEPLTITIKDLGSSKSGIAFSDKNDNSIEIQKQKDDSYKTLDERFSLYSFRFLQENEKNYIIVFLEDSDWPFEVTEDGIFFHNKLGKLVDLDPVPGIGFENKLDFGSGRGLIWSRTLPLIKDHIFVGSGADTFVFQYPQHDYAGKYNADWPIYNIVDKPHNMYLQIAVNTGLISLIAVLALFIGYIIWSIKLYLKSEFEDFISIAGVGIFIGICGFLTAGLVNDSSVSVAPMFWGLLGVGIAINLKLSEKA